MADPYNTQMNRQLLQCAKTGDLAGVERLLAVGADPCNNNSEPLAWAANNGHAECVKLLIPVSDPKAESYPALRWASKNGQAECVKLLIPVCDPKANSSMALLYGAQSGQAECVKLLIPVSDPKAYNSRALRYSAMNGHAECVKLLTPTSDPLIEIKGLVGDAISSGNPAILSIMIAHEPRLLKLMNLPSLLEEAMAQKHAELAHLLSSIIEGQSISAHLPQPTQSLSSTAPRL